MLTYSKIKGRFSGLTSEQKEEIDRLFNQYYSPTRPGSRFDAIAEIAAYVLLGVMVIENDTFRNELPRQATTKDKLEEMIKERDNLQWDLAFLMEIQKELNK